MVKKTMSSRQGLKTNALLTSKNCLFFILCSLILFFFSDDVVPRDKSDYNNIIQDKSLFLNSSRNKSFFNSSRDKS